MTQHSEPETAQPEPIRKPRLLALDLLRLLAMVSMIEGHTLDVLLHPGHQANSWYLVWEFVRGFTAPMFLTLSGFSFALVTVRGWERHLSFSPAVRRRLRRFSFFVVLGYAMHFPVHHLADLRWLDAEGWRSGLQVDVLQAIGVTLLLLQALVWLARTPKRFAAIALALSAIVIFATPLLWTAHWTSHLPTAVASYLHGNTGSLFPLFPWSGYVLLGAALGATYEISKRGAPALSRALMLGGLFFAVAGYELQSLGFTLYPNDVTFWRTSPNLFLMRAGAVLLLLGAGLPLRQLPARASTVVRTLAQESLLVYFLHVCLLYGSIWNPGLRQIWGSSFNLTQSVAAAALLVVMSFGAAAGWRITRNAGVFSALGTRAAALFRRRQIELAPEPAGD